MRSWRRIWIVYYKSKEYLDRLLQVGGIFGSSTTSQRRTSQHPSKGSHPGRLLRFHQRRTTLIKWPPRPDGASILVGRARALEGHKSSKLPSSVHPFAPPFWLGGPRHWKGTSPPSYPAQPTLLRLHLGRAGPSIGRARVLQATRFSPPFCASNLVGRAQALEGHEASKLLGSTHLYTLSTWSGGLGHQMGTQSSKLPDPSPLLCATNPNNLSCLEPFQEGRTLDSLMTTSPSRGHSVTRR
jgi:hypothetical protein